MIGFLLAILSLLKTAAFENYPANRLNYNKAEGISLNTGVSYDMLGPSGTAVIQCEQASTLVVQGDLTGAASGDLVVKVTPYEEDLTTISGVDLPVVQSTGPTLASGHVYYYGQYDITGISAVRVRFTNNNAGTQTLTRGSWKIS